jgi:HTH-type transcriptional regulator / antitoxin HipB
MSDGKSNLGKMVDFEKSFGSIVQFHRKAAGLSQQQLAQYANVGLTPVKHVEQGKKTIQLDTLIKILTVLNIKLKFESKLQEQYEENT